MLYSQKKNPFIPTGSGGLVLGTPINQIITGIQNVYRTIKNVELAYCNKEPFGRDITLTLRNNGIRLHFDAHRQLLKMIELFEFSHVELHYSHSIFSTPDEPADVGRVERCFGATVPGVYDEKQQKYFLHWRGVSFCFPAQNSSSSVQASYAHGLGSLSFASSALPQLERMTIFAGPSPAKMRVPDIPMVVYCGNPHLILAESLSDDQGRLLGMRIKFSIEDVTENSTEDLHLIQLERDIFFNDTQQEVMTKLGAPAKIYYKSEEKMLIQRRQGAAAGPERLRERGSEEGEEEMPDFFFNYFSLGMDLLFDMDSRRLIKFVLHTNVPGHFDFGIYNRCEFLIRTEAAAGGKRPAEQLEIRTESKLDQFRAIFDLPPPGKAGSAAARVSEHFGGPVVLNKCCSEGENPFGSTFCYGTEQHIFEVLDNGHIASVVLFDPQLLGP